jgi:acetyl/propionyl-CoA carboxylase alpha subunit
MKNNLTVNISGQDKIVNAEVIDKKVWFKIGEQVYSYDLLDLNEGSTRKSKSAAKSPDKILAPMPGKVTKVFISESQSVNKGDALLVMEAMKMEYTLKSDIAANVEKLNAKVGDQVTLGYLLIQLKESK